MPQIQLGENDILLDRVLSADGKYSGISEEGIAGESLSFGNICYLDSADSKWRLASTTTKDKKLGICILSASTDEDTKILLSGKVRSSSFPTLTVGAPVYLSDVVGSIAVIRPFDTRIIGYGNTADELDFSPNAYDEDTTVGKQITYYVGGVGASDSNDGLTNLTPKEHLTFIETIFDTPSTFNYSNIEVIVQGDIPATAYTALDLASLQTELDKRSILTQLDIVGVPYEYSSGVLGELTPTSWDVSTGIIDFSSSGTPFYGYDLKNLFFKIETGTLASAKYYPIHSNTDTAIKTSPGYGFDASCTIKVYSMPTLNTGTSDCINLYGYENLSFHVSNLNLPGIIYSKFIDKTYITSCFISNIAPSYTENTALYMYRCILEEDTVIGYFGVIGTPDLSGSYFESCIFTSAERVDPTPTGYGLYLSSTSTRLYYCLFFGQAIGIQNDGGASKIEFNITNFERCYIGLSPGCSVVINLGQTRFFKTSICVLCEGANFKDYVGGTMRVTNSPHNPGGYDLVTAYNGSVLNSDTFANLAAGTAKGNAREGSSFNNIDVNTFYPTFPKEYDNTNSGLNALTYNEAIDEISAQVAIKIDKHGLVGTDKVYVDTVILAEHFVYFRINQNQEFSTTVMGWSNNVYYDIVSNAFIGLIDNLIPNILYYLYVWYNDINAVGIQDITPLDEDFYIPIATLMYDGVSNWYVQTRTKMYNQPPFARGLKYIDGLKMTYPSVSVPATLQIESGKILRQNFTNEIPVQTSAKIWYRVDGTNYTFLSTSLPYADVTGTPAYCDTSTNLLTALDVLYPYACYWIYTTAAMHDIIGTINIIPTHNFGGAHTTLNAAIAEPIPDISNVNFDNEWLLLYRVIYDYTGALVYAEDYRPRLIANEITL